jgi:hypothetical protein
MVNEKKDEEMEKGFVVKDKRFSAKKEEEGDSTIKEEGKREAPKEEIKEEMSGQDAFLPEANFSSLILSLTTSVLIQLGEIQDPNNKQATKNLPLAKQTIDLIGMLKEKTKGNLTPEEEKFVENILFDLKMRYVKASG